MVVRRCGRVDGRGYVAMTVFTADEVESYDQIADALAGTTIVTLRCADGTEYVVPAQLVEVISQAVHYLARDKAVEVTPRSRYRFI